MTNWPTSSLDKVASVFNGKTPSKDEQRSEGHPVLKIRNVSELGLFRGNFESFVEPSLADKHVAKKVRAGDTLVLNAAHNADYVASKTFRASSPTFGALATGEWLIVRPNELALDAGFTNHWINSARTRAQLRELVNGIHLYPKDVARLKIPLPPLEEQRRIAAILDQTETLRTQRRAALAQLDSLTQSIFLDMFGDPVTNPKGWPLSTMGGISEVQGGLQVSAARKDLPIESPYLRVANVYRGFLDLSEIKIIRATAAEIARTTLIKDDLLVVEGHGNPNEIGRAALWTGEVTDCVHQNHLIRARFNLMKVVPVFACEYVNSPGGRQHLLRAGKSTSGLNTISVSNVRATPVALPPLPLQQTFATRIQAIESLKTTHRKALAALDALFAALQQRAFCGDLTRSESPAPATHSKRDISAMCTLDFKKMVEAMIYVAKRMPQHDFYKSLKALYSGDRQHLENHGCLIYGETYEALDHGPVPKAAYALTKSLDEAASNNLFADDAMPIPLRRTGNQLIPTRDADFGLLGSAERMSLDWAIKYYGPMNFSETKTVSHDSAYLATAPNAPIAIEDIIRTLSKAAQDRFFG